MDQAQRGPCSASWPRAKYCSLPDRPNSVIFLNFSEEANLRRSVRLSSRAVRVFPPPITWPIRPSYGSYFIWFSNDIAPWYWYWWHCLSWWFGYNNQSFSRAQQRPQSTQQETLLCVTISFWVSLSCICLLVPAALQLLTGISFSAFVVTFMTYTTGTVSVALLTAYQETLSQCFFRNCL